MQITAQFLKFEPYFFADIASLYFVGLKSSAIEMKPYIDIEDSIKASSMAKFDGLI